MTNPLIKYILGILVGVDEEANAIAGGNPHYTISQRLGFARQEGSKVACMLCRLLSLLFNSKDHCGASISGYPRNLPTEG